MKFTTLIFVLGLLTVSLVGTAQNADINLLKNINPQFPNAGFWKFTSKSTYVFSVALPAGVLIDGLIKNDAVSKQKSLEIFGAIVTELLISEGIKYSINRQRPALKYPNDIFPYQDLHGPSFPSGHSSMSFAVAASLSIQYKKWYVTLPAYLWAGSVGYSRMYLGVHYPSDVLAGAFVGIGSAYLANWFNRKLINRERKVAR